ncbi:OadG-related small transporter subunit [Anaerotruncus colihominis]|uniref:OadG-related small transporter subunit n=1 Tax=Anaerotruncus colihominis TaxID=169435 RepID=UPI00191BDC7A|nr:OadG-related small transporter subunit [Anaerotruncus colihominis]
MFDAVVAADLIASLKIMGLGMGGIFAVMLIIMGVVALLGRFGADEEEPSGKARS